MAKTDAAGGPEGIPRAHQPEVDHLGCQHAVHGILEADLLAPAPPLLLHQILVAGEVALQGLVEALRARALPFFPNILHRLVVFAVVEHRPNLLGVLSAGVDVAGSGLCPGLGRQVGNGEIELPSAQQLLILHEAVHILGAVVVGLGELVVASHEVLLEFFVIFLELGVLVRRHRVVLLPLHDPASTFLYLLL